MTIAVVYFCYSKDEEMLNLSLDNIDFLRKYDDIDIYLIDDINDPIKNIPINVKYIGTSFNRNKNMNGIECYLNIIDIYNRIFKSRPYDWVIKIDCDTIINTWKPFRNADPKTFVQIGSYNSAWGTDENLFVISYGTVHGFSKFGLENIQSEIQNNLKQYTNWSSRFPEDVISCRMACLGNENLNFYITNYVNNPLIDNTEIGLYQDYKCRQCPLFEKDIPLKFLTNYSSITFKNTRKAFDSGISYNQHRIEALNRMSEYVKLGLNKLEDKQ